MKSRPILVAQASAIYRHCAERLPPSMTDATRAVLTKLVSSVIEVERGDALLHSGTDFKALHLLVEGAFKSLMLGEDGQQQVIHFYWPTELMALEAFSSHRHATDLIALTPALVYEFPLAAIEQASAKNPEFFSSLVQHVSDQLVEAESDQFMLGSLHATQRLAFFLTTSQRARKQAGLDPDIIDLPMTRKDIGSYLGLTTESVSRLLKWMDTMGIIQVDRRRITIREADELRSLLEDTPAMSPLSPKQAVGI